MKWWRRKQREEDLERELRSDLEIEAAERREQGLSEKEAEYAARRSLGNLASIKEEVRDAWGWRWLDTLVQDIRFAIRNFGRYPAATAIIICTLAAGIGANTAVFSIFDAVLLRQP